MKSWKEIPNWGEKEGRMGNFELAHMTVLDNNYHILTGLSQTAFLVTAASPQNLLQTTTHL